MSPARAIVRPPGRSYPDALTRQKPVPQVDLAKARDQHAAYVAALRDCGLDTVELPADDERPDAVFVQDPAVVVGGRAFVARPAAPSRAGEAEAPLAILKRHMPVVELDPPATLDGGDVFVTDSRVFVGLSARTNREACERLSALAGVPVEGVPVPDGLLHLLTGCSWLGSNRLLVVESLVDRFPDFKRDIVPEREAYAANALIAGSHAVIPRGCPRTADLLRCRGFEVHTVAMSEFRKRDGGVTCLSLLF